MEHSLYSNLAGLGTDQPGQQGGDGQVGPFVGGYNYENDAGFDHQQQTLDSTAGEEINKTPDVGHRIVLQDVEAYYDSLADSRKEQFERAAAENHVSDAPTNPAEQRVYIKRLFDAFVNTANVIDKPCKNGNVAQSVRRFLENYYPELAIEKACWEIFVSLHPFFHLRVL
jgi:hypothetical protein